MSATKLLVSVRDHDEAAVALLGGADIIDAKEPTRGALGPVAAAELAAIARVIDGVKPLSAACGELVDCSTAASPSPLQETQSVHYRKYGLANAATEDWKTAAISLAARFPNEETILVAYVDHERCGGPDPMEVADWVLTSPSISLLFDTAGKDGRSLFDWIDAVAVASIVSSFRAAGKSIGLAGSLRGESFELAVSLRPHVVGVRGAACSDGQRQSQIDADRVRALAEFIAAHSVPPQPIPVHAAD